MGYLNLRPEQTNIFFKLMEERYRQHATIITTNLDYSEWANFLGATEAAHGDHTLEGRAEFRLFREPTAVRIGETHSSLTSPGENSMNVQPQFDSAGRQREIAERSRLSLPAEFPDPAISQSTDASCDGRKTRMICPSRLFDDRIGDRVDQPGAEQSGGIAL